MSMKKGQHIFGTVKVGEKGQIVIPKEARQIFDIKYLSNVEGYRTRANIR